MKFLSRWRSDDRLHGSERKREEWNSTVALLSTKSIMLFGNKSRERLFRPRVYVTRFIIRSRKYESLSNQHACGLRTISGRIVYWRSRQVKSTNVRSHDRVSFACTYVLLIRSITFQATRVTEPLFSLISLGYLYSSRYLRCLIYKWNTESYFLSQIFFLWQNSFLQIQFHHSTLLHIKLHIDINIELY